MTTANALNPAISPNSPPKRFSLSLSVEKWRDLASELRAMEHAPHSAAVPIEKQIERDRAGEQLATYVGCVVTDSREQPGDHPLTSALPLLRATAKYLLTACDRRRRRALGAAWQARHTGQADDAARLLDEARLWDTLMRDLSSQHGVVHPLSEMVTPLSISDAELGLLGLPVDTLLNGQDLLAQ